MEPWPLGRRGRRIITKLGLAWSTQQLLSELWQEVVSEKTTMVTTAKKWEQPEPRNPTFSDVFSRLLYHAMF